MEGVCGRKAGQGHSQGRKGRCLGQDVLGGGAEGTGGVLSLGLQLLSLGDGGGPSDRGPHGVDQKIPAWPRTAVFLGEAGPVVGSGIKYGWGFLTREEEKG